MKRTWPDELTCQEVVELVTRYDEGALPDDERRLFEEHLAICDACVTYCDQLRHAGLIACRHDHDHGAPLDPALEAMLLSVFRASLVLVLALAACGDDGATGGLDPGGRTHNVLDNLPGQPGYSPLRSISAYDTFHFDHVHDLASATTWPPVSSDLFLLNLPVVEAP